MSEHDNSGESDGVETGQRGKNLPQTILTFTGGGTAIGCFFFSLSITALCIVSFKWHVGVLCTLALVGLFVCGIPLLICVLLDRFIHRWWLISVLVGGVAFFGMELATTFGERCFVMWNSDELERLVVDFPACQEITSVESSGSLHTVDNGLYAFHDERRGQYYDSAKLALFECAKGYAERLRELNIWRASRRHRSATFELAGSGIQPEYRYLIYLPDGEIDTILPAPGEKIHILGKNWFVSVIEHKYD